MKYNFGIENVKIIIGYIKECGLFNIFGKQNYCVLY